jgi:serine/threonine-protein kinase
MPSSAPEDWTSWVGDSLRRHEEERASRIGEPVAPTSGLSQDERFVLEVVALERNLITPQQLDECRRELDEARARGESLSLEALLRRKNWITAEALEDLLKQGIGDQESPLRRRYEIRDRAGEGATSVVYSAWDRELGRMVALKLIREKAGFSEVARERFRREVHAAASISHPNVVTLHDAGSEGGRLYLVMEMVDGSPLSERLTKRPADELLRVLAKAARGVAAAHEKGIVHRDLKPANILVTTSGEPKVGDFGLAHLADSGTDLTRTGATLGTPQYMAPEQVQGRSREVTPRTDVYALGAILYELLTGAPPHGSEDLVELYRRIVSEEPVPPRVRRPSLAADLQTICLKALEKDPARRYSTAKEFADDLDRQLAGEPILARPGGALARLVKTLARRRIAVAVVVTLAAVIASAAAWTLRTQQAVADYQAANDRGNQFWSNAVQLMRVEGFDPAVIRDQVQKAALVFKKSSDAFPERVEPRLMIARCQLFLGRGDLAEQAWTDALARDPGSFAARYERGKYYLGTYASLRRAPEMQLGDGRLRLGKMPTESPEAAMWRVKGEADLRQARASRSIEPSQLGYLEGLLAYGEGNYAAAGKALTAYADSNPWDSRALVLIGSAFYLAKDPEAARRYLSPALRLEPRADTYKARGDAHCCLGKFGDAAEDYSSSLKIDPDNVGARCNRAIALQVLGRLEEAEADAARAIELQPTLARAFNIRGSIRAARKNLSGAIEDFQNAALHDFYSAEAYNNLANVLAMRHELEDAIAKYDFALDLDPEYAAAYYNRGMAYARKGESRKAAEDFRGALRGDPRNYEALYQLAQCTYDLGEREEALSQLRQALEAAPENWLRREAAARQLQKWAGK